MRTFDGLTPADRECAHMVLDDIAENLGFLATHIATCRLYAEINDLAGLNYSLNTGKALMRAALERNNDLRRITGAAAAIAPRTNNAEAEGRPPVARQGEPHGEGACAPAAG